MMYRILNGKWAVWLDITPEPDMTMHQPTRSKLMHGHAPVFSLSFHCPPRGAGTLIRKKQPGYGMIENHTQACRPEAPPGLFFRVVSNNWRAQIISSTEYALGRSEHAWRGLIEKPDVNITSVVNTYTLFQFRWAMSHEPFDCFIPHSIIAMVKG